METVPGVDKETVKAAVLEILEGIPSFCAFTKQGNPDPTQDRQRWHPEVQRVW